MGKVFDVLKCWRDFKVFVVFIVLGLVCIEFFVCICEYDYLLRKIKGNLGVV